MKAGKAFEQKVYSSITSALANKELGLDPSLCKVFHRKAYYSRDRQKEIIVDIALEIYAHGQSKPSIVWVWECKDYSGSIPVDDVEEFHSKLEQIGADNTKGTIICRGTLQKAALNYAISKGIGVARLLPDNSIKMGHPITARGMLLAAEIYQSISDGKATEGLRKLLSEDLRNALHNSEFVSWSRDFYGVTSDGLIEPWGHLYQFIAMELKSWGVLPGQFIDILPGGPIELESVRIVDA